jgi:short-subunit dehydrogenase
MRALITGASSGIGRDMAIILSQMGYDLILVARRSDRLQALKDFLKTNVEILCVDLSCPDLCKQLYETVKDKDIGILINNAGFGLLGRFGESDLETELKMIDTNIKAVHILTKLFLRDFKAKNRGYILNVASSAAFLPGPLMATYYGTKAYVLRLTQAVREELRREKSNVYAGAFCPGPVDTEFGKVAGASFAVKSIESKYAAQYAIKNMFAKKAVIVPGLAMKAARVLCKLTPDFILTRTAYNLQKRKKG